MNLGHNDDHLLEAMVEHEVEVSPDIAVKLDVLSLFHSVHPVKRDHLQLVDAHHQVQLGALPHGLLVQFVVGFFVRSKVTLVNNIACVLKWCPQLKPVLKYAHLHIRDFLDFYARWINLLEGSSAL